MAVRAVKAGAIDFIEKPFSDQLLLDRVRQALEIDRQAREVRASARGGCADASRRSAHASARCSSSSPPARPTRRSRPPSVSAPKTVEVHRAHVMSKMAVELAGRAHPGRHPRRCDQGKPLVRSGIVRNCERIRRAVRVAGHGWRTITETASLTSFRERRASPSTSSPSRPLPSSRTTMRPAEPAVAKAERVESPDPIRLYLRQASRSRPARPRGGESSLARRIDVARRERAAAVLGSPLGLRWILGLPAAIRDGDAAPRGRARRASRRRRDATVADAIVRRRLLRQIARVRGLVRSRGGALARRAIALGRALLVLGIAPDRIDALAEELERAREPRWRAASRADATDAPRGSSAPVACRRRRSAGSSSAFAKPTGVPARPGGSSSRRTSGSSSGSRAATRTSGSSSST